MVLHIDREKEKIALGLKQKAHSPWDQVDEKYPVGSDAQGRGRQRDELRRVREARAGHRGPGPHQRDVLDPARQPSQRAGAHRRRDQRRRSRHRQGEAGALARHEADAGEPLDPVAEKYPAEHARRRARSATSPTTARSSSSKKGSTACCTSATCRGPARSAIPTRCSRRARRSSARSSRSIRSGGASPWA